MTGRFYSGMASELKDGVALNLQNGPSIKRKFKSSDIGNCSDPSRMDVEGWIDGEVFYQTPSVQPVYYDREVAQALPVIDEILSTPFAYKFENKAQSVKLDPKSAVNFTRTASNASSYNAGTIKT
jgi:hypothetical protein